MVNVSVLVLDVDKFFCDWKWMFEILWEVLEVLGDYDFVGVFLFLDQLVELLEVFVDFV